MAYCQEGNMCYRQLVMAEVLEAIEISQCPDLSTTSQIAPTIFDRRYNMCA